VPEPQSERVERFAGDAAATRRGYRPLPWSWAHERLAASAEYWVVALSPRRRSALLRVCGVWHEDSLWFTVAIGSRMDHHLALDPGCSASVTDTSDIVMIDGGSEPVTDPADLHLHAGLLAQKYEAHRETTKATVAGGISFRLMPRLAFGSAQDACPTRWWFG